MDKKAHSFATIHVSDAAWNYTCGYCRACYMGVSDSEDGANRWGEDHKKTCMPRPSLAR
jgi:hypothetical protein